MATTPEQPGFESDVDELPEDQDNGDPNTLEDRQPEDEQTENLEEAQEEAAEERKEGGYQ